MKSPVRFAVQQLILTPVQRLSTLSTDTIPDYHQWSNAFRWPIAEIIGCFIIIPLRSRERKEV